MKKMKSIFLCALGALSLAGCNSAAKGEKLVENDAKNDNPANVLNENVEVVLSYEDIFQQYYDLTVAKLNAQNKVVDFTIADFRDNYYESNLRLLKDRVIRIAAVLRDLGLRPGEDNAAIMLANCPEWEEIYLALACVGITAVPMDARLKKREVVHILSDSQARVIFAGPAFAEMLGIIGGELPTLKTCIFVGSPEILPEASGNCDVKSFEALVEASPLNDAAKAW